MHTLTKMGNFVSQINDGPTACKRNTAEYNQDSNGHAMIIMLVAFSAYILWNLFCYAEYAFKVQMCRNQHGNNVWAYVSTTQGTKLLSTESLTIVTKGV